jgi:hypothetical protein
MTGNPDDLEAYVAGVERAALMQVLGAALGPLSVDQIDPHQWVYARDGLKIVVNSKIQDGFTSVWVVGSSCWSSSAEFARFLARTLRCRVRCDPGDAYPQVSPYADAFLEIADGQERIIEWR